LTDDFFHHIRNVELKDTKRKVKIVEEKYLDIGIKYTQE
jgi:hypothetical protein